MKVTAYLAHKIIKSTAYDVLVFAKGSDGFLPPLLFVALPGVPCRGLHFYEERTVLVIALQENEVGYSSYDSLGL